MSKLEKTRNDELENVAGGITVKAELRNSLKETDVEEENASLKGDIFSVPLVFKDHILHEDN
ncbi:MAG: hypothetical protein Q4E88_01565 [Coriobacteriia bacterium]|nr:hypothetical protein [Coriobacteriia bacterium]